MIIDSGSKILVKFQTAKSSNNLESLVVIGGKNHAAELAVNDEDIEVSRFTGTVDEIFIHNADTVSHDVEVMVLVDGKEITVCNKNVAADQTLRYSISTGFELD